MSEDPRLLMENCPLWRDLPRGLLTMQTQIPVRGTGCYELYIGLVIPRTATEPETVQEYHLMRNPHCQRSLCLCETPAPGGRGSQKEVHGILFGQRKLPLGLQAVTGFAYGFL